MFSLRAMRGRSAGFLKNGILRQRSSSYTTRQRFTTSPRSFLASIGVASGICLSLASSPFLSPSSAACASASAAESPDRVVTRSELLQHRSRGSAWVVMGGVVYDVTDFLEKHPGGMEPLLGAAGQEISQFWQLYPIHSKSGKALEALETMCTRVGVLQEDPAGEIAHEEEGLPLAVQSATSRSGMSLLKLAAVGLQGPLWSFVRLLLRIVATVFPVIGPSIANCMAKHILPVSFPGFGLPQKDKRSTRVAVVGGGIAGTACAYTLVQSGYQVTLYEARAELGGNAQAFSFPVQGAGGSPKTVDQDVAVLFWAPEYYKNYEAFLTVLGIQPEEVEVPYVLRTNRFGGTQYYTPPDRSGNEKSTFSTLELEFEKHDLAKEQQSLKLRFRNDFDRYDRMISFCDAVCTVFAFGDRGPSFYNKSGLLATFNPLNFVSVRKVCKAFCISDEFYNTVLRPFQGIQFSTLNWDELPAVALPTLNDIVPLTKARTHRSWGQGNSRLVFQTATQGIDTRLATRVTGVQFLEEKGREPGGWNVSQGHIVVTDDRGASEQYDRIVFAVSNSHAVANILGGACASRDHSIQHRRGNLNFLEDTLLRGVRYHDSLAREDWKDWLVNPVHTDASAILDGANFDPARVDRTTTPLQNSLLQNAAFLIAHDANSKGTGELQGLGSVEYHHILGSWSPSARLANCQGAPMFMSQCLKERNGERIGDSTGDVNGRIAADKVVGYFNAPRGHPDLSIRNMAITQMMHLIQGRRGVYYCGNWTGPGNGHDLSLLTGISVATAIGATYPFPQHTSAKKDWKGMLSFMSLSTP